MRATTSFTARQLNRATLARQLLLGREQTTVPEGVQRIVALQAQEPASPYLALWNRLVGFDPADLDAAFADGTVVKASLIRLTLHAVHADDYPAFHQAMLPSLRASRLADRRFRETGLSVADADALVPGLLEYLEEPRSGSEIEHFLAESLGEHVPRLWWALRMFAPLHHAPTGPPWSFDSSSSSSFVAAPTSAAESPDGSVQRLLMRYLQAFGPASARDFAQFTMLRRPVVREALEALADEITEGEGPEGSQLFDVSGTPVPSEDSEAPPRLLPMWDNVLLAYSERSRVIPPDYRPMVIRRNGDVLPTLLVNGYVAGVWRPVEGGIEVTAFHRLDDETWQGLATEAASLLAFLDERGAGVYGRYGHWWDKLSGEQTRLLPP